MHSDVKEILLSEKEIEIIKKYLINPVDQRLASLEKCESLLDSEVVIEPVREVLGFINSILLFDSSILYISWSFIVSICSSDKLYFSLL